MVTNFSNVAVDTTLNGAITNVATSLVVVSATGYPAVPFNIQIENEVIRVGAKSGTTFSTLTRGYDGTTGVSHVDGSAVKHVVIAEDVGPRVQAWTPTLTNMTLGNGTVDAFYQADGQVCWIYFLFVLGSTSAIATNPAFSLPVNAVRPAADITWEYNVVGAVKLRDISVDQVYFGQVSLSSDTSCLFLYNDVSGSLISHAGIQSTLPFTWAAGDSLAMSGSYRIG